MVLEYFCPICQEEFLTADDIWITRCRHVFHKKCLHDWLATHSTCPDCRTPCMRTQTFKVFIKSRDSQLINDMIKEIDAKNATIFTLQLNAIELNDDKSPVLTPDKEVKSNLKKTENESIICTEIAEKDKIIKDLDLKLREKSLELEKEIRNSTLMIVEKMKLQQQLTDAGLWHMDDFRQTYTADVLTMKPNFENLNIQLKKSHSNAPDKGAGVCGVNKAVPKNCLQQHYENKRTGNEDFRRNQNVGYMTERSTSNSYASDNWRNCSGDSMRGYNANDDRRRLNDAVFELFNYSKKLYRVGYQHIYYKNNLIYAKNHDSSTYIEINNKQQVDWLVRNASMRTEYDCSNDEGFEPCFY